MKWNFDNLKEYVEKESKCKFLNFERKKSEYRTDIILYLKCECGKEFNLTLSSFNDKRRPKRTCNDCTNKNVSKKMSKWNNDNLKELVENNSEYKFLFMEKIKNNKNTGYTLYLHIVDFNGYKYRLSQSSFMQMIKGKKSYIEKISKGNFYKEYNAKLLIESNTNYRFDMLELKNNRYKIHFHDIEDFKYSINKSMIDSMIKKEVNSHIVKFGENNEYTEYNIKLLFSKEELQKYIYIKYVIKNKQIYVHCKDVYGYKYCQLVGNVYKHIKLKDNIPFLKISKHNIYSKYNAKKYVEENSSYTFQDILYKNDCIYLQIKDSNLYKYRVLLHSFKSMLQNNTNFAFVLENNIFSINNIQRWLDIHNLEYTILSTKYNDAHKKLKWKCNNGHVFTKSWNEVQSGGICPHCQESRGEKRIQIYLESKNYYFKYQYKFKNCKYKNELPFDFAIFDDENKLQCLVEYDGQQHYRPINFGGISDDKAIKEYKGTIKRDKIKNDYCKVNNIKLIRIPYWDFDNIESILDNILINNNIKEEYVI